MCIVSLKCRTNVVTCFSERKIVGLTVWEETKLKDESSILLVISGRHLVAKGWVGRSATATWACCVIVWNGECYGADGWLGASGRCEYHPVLLFGHVRVGNAILCLQTNARINFVNVHVHRSFIAIWHRCGGGWKVGWLLWLTIAVFGDVM